MAKTSSRKFYSAWFWHLTSNRANLEVLFLNQSGKGQNLDFLYVIRQRNVSGLPPQV